MITVYIIDGIFAVIMLIIIAYFKGWNNGFDYKKSRRECEPDKT